MLGYLSMNSLQHKIRLAVTVYKTVFNKWSVKTKKDNNSTKKETETAALLLCVLFGIEGSAPDGMCRHYRAQSSASRGNIPHIPVSSLQCRQSVLTKQSLFYKETFLLYKPF